MERDELGPMECEPPAQRDDAGNDFFELGLRCTTGSAAAIDLVSAHKWFNVDGRDHDGAACGARLDNQALERIDSNPAIPLAVFLSLRMIFSESSPIPESVP